MKRYPTDDGFAAARRNAGRKWTQQDDERLIFLSQKNTPQEEICRLLHRRPRGVQKRLMHLLSTPNGSRALSARHQKPWKAKEHAWMLGAWQEGSTVAEIALHLGRTPYAVYCRLVDYGQYSGGFSLTAAQPTWTDEDKKTLFRMVDARCTPAQMAEALGCSTGEVEAWLYYAGLWKRVAEREEE